MKKLAIGCGVVAVILLVCGAIATYFVVNKVQSTLKDFAAFGEIPAIERQVRKQEAFTPPPSGELTEAQMTRYLEVQRHERGLLGTRVDEFNKQYGELAKRMDKDQGTVLDAPTVIAAYRDLARAYVDAKRAQVEALNAQGFSLDEYQWVRRQAYAAVGMPVADFDLAQFIDDMQAGKPPESVGPPIAGSFGPSGPEANKTLVAPHKKALEDNAALSFFGL
jgi:hypothetical protein